MSVSYLFKDFLRLEDVGEYLNQYGYSYNPELEEDYYRLKNTILDLYHENKLNVVFYYDDFAVIKTLRFTENLAVEEIEAERFEYYISGYFHVPEVKTMIEDGGYLNIIKSTYGCYHLYDKEKLPVYDNEYKVEAGHKFTSIEFGDNLAPSVIEFPDLRFPKADLDKLFNEKNSELKGVKDELADLKGQLKQAKADLAYNPANNTIDQNHLYNWQAMDKNQYPPELHLAIEIWQEYYQADAVEHITQFDSGRFNRISTKLNLSNGNLKSRIRSLLTPLESKLKSPSLIDSLREVNIIYTDKLEQD